MEDSKVVLDDGLLQPIPENVESESDKMTLGAGSCHTSEHQAIEQGIKTL